jgi:hypothetical protein
VSAAVGTAATVETATAAGATTDCAASAAVEGASTAEAATDRGASNCSALHESATSTEASSATVKASSATVKVASAAIEVAPKSVEPRASTDKQTARKILGAVVAVRRACIGIKTIVAVGTYRRWAEVTRPHSDRNANLRLGATCCEYN